MYMEILLYVYYLEFILCMVWVVHIDFYLPEDIDYLLVSVLKKCNYYNIPNKIIKNQYDLSLGYYNCKFNINVTKTVRPCKIVKL